MNHPYVPCADCGELFLKDNERKTVCRECYLVRRMSRSAPPPPAHDPPRRASETGRSASSWVIATTIDQQMLRRLVHLCHPDKHDQSEASVIATHFLLDLRRQLDRSAA